MRHTSPLDWLPALFVGEVDVAGSSAEVMIFTVGIPARTVLCCLHAAA
jgi:hypothetical protein